MSDESLSLELRSVVQRFKDSNQVLDQLRERLRLLAGAEETQAVAASNIGEASDRLRNLASELERETVALVSAVSETKAAMEAARVFLQGTDIKAIREDVGRLAADQAALVAASSRTVELLEQELASTRRELSGEVQSRQQLEAKIAAIPERTRRKHGL